MRYRSERKRHVRRLHLDTPEQLEDRRLLATFTVVNTENIGPGSLRQAMLDANAAANPAGDVDHIEFNIPGSGVQTIRVMSNPLPEVTDPVWIDGYTQPESIANSSPVSAGVNAVPLIEIDGSAIQDSASGLTISAGGSTVRGLVIGGFSAYGIERSPVRPEIASRVTGSERMPRETTQTAIRAVYTPRARLIRSVARPPRIAT